MPSQRIILGIGLAILLLIGAASIGLDLKSRADTASVDHALEVLKRISDIRPLLRRAESAARGFALTGNPDFVIALSPGGQAIILAAAALAVGNGPAARLRLCQDPTPQPPRNGEILREHRSGRNRALVTNTGGQEVVVKFREPDGTVAVALFVGAHSQAAIEDFPDGSCDPAHARTKSRFNLKRFRSKVIARE